MHFKCAKKFSAKLCKTMFFAHMGCAVALTANRNKIVFYFLKSSFKCSKNKGKKFAKICKFPKFAKKLHFFQKIFMLFYFLPYRYSTIIFCNFQKFTPKIFFCKNKIFNSIPIEVLLQCFLKTLQISSYKLFYFS